MSLWQWGLCALSQSIFLSSFDKNIYQYQFKKSKSNGRSGKERRERERVRDKTVHKHTILTLIYLSCSFSLLFVLLVVLSFKVQHSCRFAQLKLPLHYLLQLFARSLQLSRFLYSTKPQDEGTRASIERRPHRLDSSVPVATNPHMYNM
jgi:hypothetical protein